MNTIQPPLIFKVQERVLCTSIGVGFFSVWFWGLGFGCGIGFRIIKHIFFLGCFSSSGLCGITGQDLVTKTLMLILPFLSGYFLVTSISCKEIVT